MWLPHVGRCMSCWNH